MAIEGTLALSPVGSYCHPLGLEGKWEEVVKQSPEVGAIPQLLEQ